MDRLEAIRAVADDYMNGVLDGAIAASHWTRRAIERHRRDLETAGERGLEFREDKAAHAVAFFSFLRHSKGKWAGQVFELAPWQTAVLWILFGWYRSDGTRRFRTAYIEVPRKNGKTSVAAGIGLYLLVADGEAGAEVYSGATKRDQARLSHSEATRMVKASRSMKRLVTIFKDNLLVEDTASKFVPLGADADSLDGLNVHGAIIDELHAHKSRDLWDVIETARGARAQPMTLAITTAGFNKYGICYEQREYVTRILDGLVEDDSYFGIIYTIDEEDDWKDPAVWAKANPNLGVSVSVDDFRTLAAQAAEMPSKLNSFLCKKLNVWTEAETRWITPDAWAACAGAVDADSLEGRVCYAGLDLSSNRDITALVLVFPPEAEGDPYRILPRFWIPQDNLRERVERDRVPYDVWLRQGFVTATPGDVIDYRYILEEIDELGQRYDIAEVAFDRWGATKIVQDLEEMGANVVAFGQGFASMSPPTKELETLILQRRIAHGGNPVLAWMAANVVVREDPAGNLKPDKSKSIEKIDGVVAMIMGLDRALRNGDDVTSVYDERGVVEI